MNYFEFRFGRGRLPARFSATTDAVHSWEEGEHPRTAKGGSGGGRFAKKPETLAKEDSRDILDPNDGGLNVPSGSGGDGGDASFWENADREYAAAVESGDLETAKRIFGDAARKAFGGMSPFVSNQDGPYRFSGPVNSVGGWASSSKNDWGAKNSVFFALKNPFNLMEHYDGPDPFDFDAIERASWSQRDIDDAKSSAFCDVMEKAGVPVDRKTIMANFRSHDQPTIKDLIADVGRDVFEKAMRKLGYDGYVWDFDDSVVTAFDPSAVMSASPIVRDSGGNAIPLSQRFAKAIPAD